MHIALVAANGAIVHLRQCLASNAEHARCCALCADFFRSVCQRDLHFRMRSHGAPPSQPPVHGMIVGRRDRDIQGWALSSVRFFVTSLFGSIEVLSTTATLCVAPITNPFDSARRKYITRCPVTSSTRLATRTTQPRLSPRIKWSSRKPYTVEGPTLYT